MRTGPMSRDSLGDLSQTPRHCAQIVAHMSRKTCKACRKEANTLDFTMAFQPIVDVNAGGIYAYEALVRPRGGGSAATILDQVNDENRYSFDQACRMRAIELAASLRMQTLLSINFLPNAVYQPAACLRKTLDAADTYGFPLHHIIFEVTEGEQTRDPGHLKAIFREYKRHGMLTAIDDFGAGHSGLNLLADFQPDILKIDMALTRDIHIDKPRQVITRSITGMARDLGISVIAEGIESLGEAETLRDLGVHLFQGYLFARPGLESLPSVPAHLLGHPAEDLRISA